MFPWTTKDINKQIYRLIKLDDRHQTVKISFCLLFWLPLIVMAAACWEMQMRHVAKPFLVASTIYNNSNI